ncbi:MAG: diacylglycerol kinase family protein [Sphingomonadaceae bacterium]|nr:hypothetical protein [Sphingomonadaceae bacterium]
MADRVYEFSRIAHAGARAKDAASALADAPTASGEGARYGLIYNPRSHRNKGQDLELADHPGLLIAQPKDRDELPAVLAEFAVQGIELLAINGGDGTVRDVLTCGQAVFGTNWPKLAVLPKGKTNALNVDLGAPADWTMAGVLEAYERGKTIAHRALAISPVDDPDAQVLGFILGAGAFTIGIRAGQDAHRWGAFDSLAVGVTAGWGVIQALFGSDENIWRRGVGMNVRLGADRVPAPHSGHGDRDKREILFASTLERFPMGMKPFAGTNGQIGLAIMDKPRRRLVGVLPFVVAGYRPKWLAEAGFHQLSTDSFELELDDQFILDGEAFPAGKYRVAMGPELQFVVP